MSGTDGEGCRLRVAGGERRKTEKNGAACASLAVKHHEFAPSKLERIEGCPASWKMCRDFHPESGKDATRGSLLHEAIHNDKVLAGLSEQDQNLVMSLRNEYIEPFKSKGFKIFHELPVVIRDEDGSELTAGTLDALILSPDETQGSLIDFKFGIYEVTEAKENPQILAYCAGAFQQFPKLQTVFALIVQPVFGIGNYDKQAKIGRDELPAILKRIRQAEEAAKNADLQDLSIYHATASNCRYCNKFACPKYREWMRTNMEIVGVSEMPQEVEDMTVEYADRVKLAGKAIQAEMKSVLELADKVILDCGGSENYRVCSGKVTKKTDWKGLCAKHEITAEEIAEFTTESVGFPYLTARTRKNSKMLN